VIGVGMDDDGHAGHELGLDILENVRRRVDKEADAMTAHPRIGVGHILAEPVFADCATTGANGNEASRNSEMN